MLLQGSLRIASLTGTWVRANFTAPNIITLSGIYLTWEMFWLRLEGIASTQTFILLIGAVATDKLDGMFAKIPGQTTPLGSILDKLRDKALVLSTSYFCYQTYSVIDGRVTNLICSAIMILAGVELFLLTIGALVSLTGAKLKANDFGRWKMGFECAVVIAWAIANDLHLFSLEITDNPPLFLVSFLLTVSLTLAIASAHGQIKDNWPLIRRVANIIRSNY